MKRFSSRQSIRISTPARIKTIVLKTRPRLDELKHVVGIHWFVRENAVVRPALPTISPLSLGAKKNGAYGSVRDQHSHRFAKNRQLVVAIGVIVVESVPAAVGD